MKQAGASRGLNHDGPGSIGLAPWHPSLPQYSAVRLLLFTIREILSQNCDMTGRLMHKKVQVGKDQEKAQLEKDSHSKNRGGKKPN